MDENKYKSEIALWGFILLALQALAIIDALGIRPEVYTYLSKLQISFIAVGMIGVIITFMFLALKKHRVGFLIGMIMGALYVFTFNVFNMIAGVCFIIYCAIMFAKVGNKTEKKVEAKNK